MSDLPPLPADGPEAQRLAEQAASVEADQRDQERAEAELARRLRRDRSIAEGHRASRRARAEASRQRAAAVRRNRRARNRRKRPHMLARLKIDPWFGVLIYVLFFIALAVLWVWSLYQ